MQRFKNIIIIKSNLIITNVIRIVTQYYNNGVEIVYLKQVSNIEH